MYLRKRNKTSKTFWFFRFCAFSAALLQKPCQELFTLVMLDGIELLELFALAMLGNREPTARLGRCPFTPDFGLA